MNSRDKKRLKKIMDEFSAGFNKLASVKNGVVIFGSARTKPEDGYYKLTYDLAYKLAKEGFSVITGAGLGIMEAANKGAYDAGGVSVGLNIELPQFQNRNHYINLYHCFKHFYTRKVMFSKYSIASIAMPGGYGTVDEIFDQFAILQNKKIAERPFILFGKEFYEGLTDWLTNTLKTDKKISDKDLSLFTVSNNIDKTIDIIKNYEKKRKRFFI